MAITIFHAIGLIWVILTSCLATVIIFLLAFDGLRVRVRNSNIIHVRDMPDDMPVSVPTRVSIFPHVNPLHNPQPPNPSRN